MYIKKIVAVVIALGLFQVGCFRKTETERIAPILMNRTVMLEIPTVVEMVEMTIDGDDLKMEKKKKIGTIRCSGVFISPTGHILSCAHCFDVGEVLSINVVQVDGTVQKAELLAKDAQKDLALIKVNERKHDYAPIAESESIVVGQDALAVGYPLGLDFSLTKGIISAVHRTMDNSVDATQSDTPINPGNSGGPLFNLKGELLGINSFMIPPVNAPIFTGLGFSVSPSQIRLFLDAFKGLEKAFDR